MIVADTSACVEFLRGTAHPAALELKRLLLADTEVALTEVVVAELLAGARNDANLGTLRTRLLSLPMLHLEGLGGYEDAAEMYRACRRNGETIRSLVDCLIAVPAMRANAAILHADRDFDVIARHSDLRIHATRD